MAYEGKFIDRSPYLRPAGQVKFKKEENVVTSLVHDVKENEDRPFICKTGPQDYKLPPKRTNFYKGYYTDVRECLQPEKVCGLFGLLKREFQNTVYDSYWKKEVGRVPDPSPMLPAGIDSKKVCFGKATPSLSLAGDLINPPKSYVDVIEDSRKGHEMYIRSHMDFDPGEQFQRNYINPFIRDMVHGVSTPCDPGGSCLKKVMNNEVSDEIISNILSDYKKRTTPLVGKVLAPNNNVLCVPSGHSFGRLNKKQIYGAGELLKDSTPSLDKFELHEEISHINKLRLQIAKKQPLFPHRDFIDDFHKIDPENTGFITLQEAYNILMEFEIFPDHVIFERLLSRLNIFTRGNLLVVYEKMSDLLNVNIMFPDISKIEDIPTEFLNFETTSQAAQKYHYVYDSIKNTNNIPRAGVSSQEYVSVDSLVRPSNLSQYSLEPKDFFITRSPEYLQKLICRLGFEMDQNQFDLVWNKAMDENGCVSVDSFFKALKN